MATAFGNSMKSFASRDLATIGADAKMADEPKLKRLQTPSFLGRQLFIHRQVIEARLFISPRADLLPLAARGFLLDN
jgi:hypothetical protein